MKRTLFIILIIGIMMTMLFTACSSEDEPVGGGNGETPTDTVTTAPTQSAAQDPNIKEDPAGKTDNSGKESDGLSSKGLEMSVNNASGELQVNRKKVDDKDKSGLAEGWTVLVYLCGTDLESDGGMATGDLNEMLSAKGSDKVRFIVETGGSEYWFNDTVDPEKIQRFLVQNGEIKLIEEKKSANMGKGETLSDFIKWGMKNYASKHTGLIFWNHGGGSITGVCFDQLYDSDSIDLTELDSVLNDCLKDAGRKFDFIGFDACLMGTVETANVLATYSKYMYGSEEVEPGSGWDYQAIGDYLASKPDADGAALGKVVADSFLKACQKEDQDYETTFSIIDLSKIDKVLTTFNDFAKDLYEAGEDETKRADIVRAISGVDNFGGNNKTEGYANMIDLGGLISACSGYSKKANAALSAISDAVVYSVTGLMHEGVSGLATYYPISIQGSEELSFFGKICVSPYYLSFVDRLGSIGASGDMYWDYDDDTWFDDEGDWYWGDDWDYYDDEYWDYIDDYEQTGESPYITFDIEPTFEDGSYYFALDDYGLYNVADVYGMVYVMSEDGKEIIEYGETYDINEDWEYGIFWDNFDGYWVSLPDGQNLAIYIVGYTEDSIVYTSPVLLNGIETNLRLRMTDDNMYIEGAWDGIDEYGASDRDIIKLKKGDKIVPLYYAMDIDTYEGSEYYGDEYVFDGEPEIYYDLMYPGEYLYAFNIDDIYGDYYLTDFEIFEIDEDGNVVFDEAAGF